MSEPIKPDLILHLKRPWFAKVWNGEKDTEFRVKKEYWDSRIPKLGQRFFVEFRLTMRNGPRMLAQVSGVEIGKCPYPGWSGEFYCMRFEVVQHSLFQDGLYIPFLDGVPRMKEKANRSRKSLPKAR